MKSNDNHVNGSKHLANFLLRITLFTVGAILTFLTSCKKFVEIPPPISQLVTASVFNNNATATSAQTVIYAQMVNNTESYNMALNNGLLSDELINYGTTIYSKQFYINAMAATTISQGGPWSNAYNYIYQANQVILGITTNKGVSAAVGQQLTGEALFVRAFWHFYLTSLYGDVPLVLTTDYKQNALASRTPRLQVLQQVITDLTNAEGMLNANYVDSSDTLTTTERVRPNKSVAAALLARAYLYLGDYNNHNTGNYKSAEDAATAVIGNSALYSLCPDLNNVFLANSSEAIWQLQIPQPSSDDTPDGLRFILIAAPSSGNFGSSTISPQLLNTFEPGDLRRQNWIDSIITTSSTVPYYFPYKYKVYDQPVSTEYDMMLRLSEQYLIRAEARARQNNTSGAVSDLDVIRNRAGLPNYSGATDQTSVLATILHERQVELFTEWGHRWLDLNRTGNTTAVMSIVTPSKGGTWNPDGYQELYPIPQTDRNTDPNLTQNTGY
jgi:hypothetical protein